MSCVFSVFETGVKVQQMKGGELRTVSALTTKQLSANEMQSAFNVKVGGRQLVFPLASIQFIYIEKNVATKIFFICMQKSGGAGRYEFTDIEPSGVPVVDAYELVVGEEFVQLNCKHTESNRCFVLCQGPPTTSKTPLYCLYLTVPPQHYTALCAASNSGRRSAWREFNAVKILVSFIGCVFCNAGVIVNLPWQNPQFRLWKSSDLLAQTCPAECHCSIRLHSWKVWTDANVQKMPPYFLNQMVMWERPHTLMLLAQSKVLRVRSARQQFRS